MEINALLAHKVVKHPTGSLDLLGVFEDLFPPSMPAVHPGFFLYADIRPSVEEANRIRTFLVRLVRPDGTWLDFDPLERTSPNLDASSRAASELTLYLESVPFESYGDHEVRLYCDGRIVKTLPLGVREDR